MKKFVTLEVAEVNGHLHTVYIDDTRITGRDTKPWDGCTTVKKWIISTDDLLDSIPQEVVNEYLKRKTS